MAFPDFLSIRLEAHCPETNCHRHYEIDAGIDLLGDIVVETRFGRVGTFGRIARHSFKDQAAAIRCALGHITQRRGSRLRNGAAYQIIHAKSCGGAWADLHQALDGAKTRGGARIKVPARPA